MCFDWKSKHCSVRKKQSFIHFHILDVVIPGINEDKSSTLTGELPNLFLPRNQIFIRFLLFREDQIIESESRRKRVRKSGESRGQRRRKKYIRQALHTHPKHP